MLPRNNPTAIELAFGNLPVSALGSPLGKRVFSALERCEQQRGKGHRNGRSWSSNLSYKTFRQLVAKGVMREANERRE